MTKTMRMENLTQDKLRSEKNCETENVFAETHFEVNHSVVELNVELEHPRPQGRRRR